MKKIKHLFVFILVVFITSLSFGQKKTKTAWDSTTYSGLKFRSIGPAFMSGRIADIAIDPSDDNHWYVGAGSGGVWESKNAGVTWNSIFDSQKVYAIGCITIDQNNPSTVWVGTGENVGGRHISYGDGVYRSEDGGKTWKNMGLKTSNHISKIVLHPTDRNVIWVASQGPLWSTGGERGVFKSIDGGKSWKRTLGDDEWMGATELVIDPRDPNVLYAASWQRHRTVANYMGGGPKSGVHKSIDGGETWSKLSGGLPAGNMGKIGLAISPQNPNVLYAAIELDLRKGGVYKTENGGASWTKQSDMVAGGTGPHYYQELYACPHHYDRIYFANNYLQVSDDGGKTFRSVKKKWKHVDNHAVVFRKDDPDYLLVGTDGGLYESFDLAESWRHFGNLPLTQFYKIAIDDAKPFYNIYGGTQDNSTQGGPSRTDNRSGIRNSDWRVVNGGDGHQPATEPGNPRVVYAQSQQGYYNRKDMLTGESVMIRPQPKEGESYERYNWDAPILVSAHSPTRIYVASHRLYMSEDRGDSWQTLSDDLTRNEERFDLPIMGKRQSFESPWDVYAMSTYNTITCIAESPKNDQLLYVGTDDGLIHVTENGGEKWKKINVSSLPGIDGRMYVNDIKTDLFDENTVYVLLDNHKNGDYKPYVFKSTNKGSSWSNISNNLPANHYAWRIVQDHVNPKLLFLGTEFGLHFSPNGGKHWIQLNGGLPTISFRDLAIHRTEDDLVAASFGRGIFIFDDIAVFRKINVEMITKEAALFPMRDALWFTPHMAQGYNKGGSLGGQQFIADNPPHGATLTYHIHSDYESSKTVRKKNEKKLEKANADIRFPGWEDLDEEKVEKSPTYEMVIMNSEGQVIRKLNAPGSNGFHRLTWDLKATSEFPLNVGTSVESRSGFMVLPGSYSATLYKIYNQDVTKVAGPMKFNVTPLILEQADEAKLAAYNAYKDEYMAVMKEVQRFNFELNRVQEWQKSLQSSLKNTNVKPGELDKKLSELENELLDINELVSGSPSRQEVGEKTAPTLNERIGVAGSGLWNSTTKPTQTARDNLSIASKEVERLDRQLSSLKEQMLALGEEIKNAGGPVINGLD